MVIVAVGTKCVNTTFSFVSVVAILIIVSCAGSISSTSVPIITVVRMISVTALWTISSALGVVISLIASPQPGVVSVRVQKGLSPFVSAMNRASINVVESMIVVVVSTAITVSITTTTTASTSIALSTST